jgi:hypothetical protein
MSEAPKDKEISDNKAMPIEPREVFGAKERKGAE